MTTTRQTKSWGILQLFAAKKLLKDTKTWLIDLQYLGVDPCIGFSMARFIMAAVTRVKSNQSPINRHHKFFSESNRGIDHIPIKVQVWKKPKITKKKQNGKKKNYFVRARVLLSPFDKSNLEINRVANRIKIIYVCIFSWLKKRPNMDYSQKVAKMAINRHQKFFSESNRGIDHIPINVQNCKLDHGHG